MTMTTTPETKTEAERRRKAEYNARRTAARRAQRAAGAALPTPEPETPSTFTVAGTTPLQKVLAHLVDDGTQGDQAKVRALKIVRDAADWIDTNPTHLAKRTLGLGLDINGDHAYAIGKLKSALRLDTFHLCAYGVCALVSDNVTLDYPVAWTTDPSVGAYVEEMLGGNTPISALNDLPETTPAQVSAELRRRADAWEAAQ